MLSNGLMKRCAVLFTTAILLSKISVSGKYTTYMFMMYMYDTL